MPRKVFKKYCTLNLFAPNQDWISDRQKLLKKLLSHPETNKANLLYAAGQFHYNFNEIIFSNERAIFELFFSHSHLNHEVLLLLARHLELNTEKFPDHHEVFKRILARKEEMSQQIFYALTRYFEKNAGTISDHLATFELLFSHPRKDHRTVLHLANYLEGNTEITPQHQSVFERLFSDEFIRENTLTVLTRYVVDNFGTLSERQEVLEDILSRPEILGEALIYVARHLGEHSERSFYHQTLEGLTLHPRLGSSYNDFGNMTEIILSDAELAPRHQTLLDNLLGHAEVKALSLSNMARVVLTVPSLTSRDQSFLEKLIAHSQNDTKASKTTAELMTKNTDKVSELQTIVELFAAHPKATDPRDNIYPITALRFAAQMAIEHPA